MTTFTLTRYMGIGEAPLVILINHPYKGSSVFNSIEELKEELLKKNEKIYFVADSKDNRINDLSTWHCDNFSSLDTELLLHKLNNYLIETKKHLPSAI